MLTYLIAYLVGCALAVALFFPLRLYDLAVTTGLSPTTQDGEGSIAFLQVVNAKIYDWDWKNRSPLPIISKYWPVEALALVLPCLLIYTARTLQRETNVSR